MIQNGSRKLSTKVSSYFYDTVKISEAAKEGVLKNIANFTEKHLCWSLFLIKLQLIKRKKVHWEQMRW